MGEQDRSPAHHPLQGPRQVWLHPHPLIPAPRGTGLVAGKIPKKVLGYAGVEDCFTSSRGATSTGGKFVKAVFNAIKATYGYNMPDLWEQVDLGAKKPPFQEFTDYLKTAEIKPPVVKKIF